MKLANCCPFTYVLVCPPESVDTATCVHVLQNINVGVECHDRVDDHGDKKQQSKKWALLTRATQVRTWRGKTEENVL